MPCWTTYSGGGDSQHILRCHTGVDTGIYSLFLRNKLLWHLESSQLTLWLRLWLSTACLPFSGCFGKSCIVHPKISAGAFVRTVILDGSDGRSDLERHSFGLTVMSFDAAEEHSVAWSVKL